MNAEQEAKLLRIADQILYKLNALEPFISSSLPEILTRLSRINSTLSAIDANLRLLETKK